VGDGEGEGEVGQVSGKCFRGAKMKKQIETKRCSKCGKVKGLDEFHNEKIRKDGKNPNCKKCRKKYYEENKEKTLCFQRVYYRENKEKKSEYGKKYFKENMIGIFNEIYNKNTCDPKIRPAIEKLIEIKNLKKELKIIREEVINLKEARNG
jgi:hypothetical protein